MKPKDRFNKLLEKFKDDPEYEAEGVLIDITEQIVRCMESQDVTRTKLAETLGCSKAYITKLLSGEENLTTKKIVEIATALKCKIDIAFVPRDHALRRTFTYTRKRSLILTIEDPFILEAHDETPQPLAA